MEWVGRGCCSAPTVPGMAPENKAARVAGRRPSLQGLLAGAADFWLFLRILVWAWALQDEALPAGVQPAHLLPAPPCAPHGPAWGSSWPR